MKSLLLAFCLIYLTFEGTNGWRIFRNGRMNGGNLREPEVDARKDVTRAVKEEWFTQKLDHFTPTNKATWQQRYFSNDQYFKEGGPVFVMIGGEGEASDAWMVGGSWINTAYQQGALLLQLEHRFYGQSHPTDDLSIANLKYLSSEQALEDLASFIVGMNEKYGLGPDVRWISFGGSYPGSLAAWLRFKFPHLIRGSMSASGPLLAKLDFQEYLKVVRDSLGTHSAECVTAVEQGFEQIDTLLTQTIGQKNIDTLFTTCDPIGESVDNPSDLANFYEVIADNFAGIVQYNNDKRMKVRPKVAALTINLICNVMVDQGIGPPVDRLGKVNDIILEAYEEKCLDYKYDKMVAELKNVSWTAEAAEGMRQWMYQTCTEFGFYQTSTGEPHTFGNRFPIDFFVQQCADLFGSDFDEDLLESVIDQTNIDYGGLDIKVTNVVFVHGSIDPWHALGIIRTSNINAPAIYINGTAHCANMYSPAATDLPDLQAAREQIDNMIDDWLRQ